jgi:hypothetical protein
MRHVVVAGGGAVAVLVEPTVWSCTIIFVFWLVFGGLVLVVVNKSFRGRGHPRALQSSDDDDDDDDAVVVVVMVRSEDEPTTTMNQLGFVEEEEERRTMQCHHDTTKSNITIILCCFPHTARNRGMMMMMVVVGRGCGRVVLCAPAFHRMNHHGGACPGRALIGFFEGSLNSPLGLVQNTNQSLIRSQHESRGTPV